MEAPIRNDANDNATSSNGKNTPTLIVGSSNGNSTDSKPAPSTKPANWIEPPNTWPPPLYISSEASDEEKYYIQYRWQSQWQWYDKKAAEAKQQYQRLQVVIGVGSVSVPVLVGITATDPAINGLINAATIVVSLTVAAAAAVENVFKFGESWRTFRSAAESLRREKSLYDVEAGPYRRAKNPFLLFTERCEEIIAQQNGQWLARYEQQNSQASQSVANTERDRDEELAKS